MCQLVKQLSVFPLNYSISMGGWLLLESMFGKGENQGTQRDPTLSVGMAAPFQPPGFG